LPGLGFHGLTLLGGDHIDDPEPGRLRWQDTPDEQDPLAKRKINCHRTSSQDLNAYSWETHLVVVDQIAYTNSSGEFKTTGGRLRRWREWHASNDRLKATRYRYRLPDNEESPSL